MLGGWPEAASVPTGFAAGDSRSFAAIAIRAWRLSMLGGWPEAASVPTGFAASSHLLMFRVCVLALALLLAMPGTASGQARLLDSDPVDGATLANLEKVTFEFDTLLRPENAVVQVIRLDGTDINVVSVDVDGTILTAQLAGQLPTGNYEVSYIVTSSDGDENVGSMRISIESPAQSLSGGLLAVVAIAVAMFAFMGFVFMQDKRRRPGR